MTATQKKAFTLLLNDCTMGKYGVRYRIWDKKRNPVMRFDQKTFIPLRKFCREMRNGYTIDKRIIRGMNKNTTAYKLYKLYK